MGDLGRGVVRIRAVTMMQKGDGEEGSSVGEDVVRVRPSFTTGFVDLYIFVKLTSVFDSYRLARTGGIDDHLLDPSCFQYSRAVLTPEREGKPRRMRQLLVCESCYKRCEVMLRRHGG